MKPGWKPERRNRNIGTANAGFKQSNRMLIPKEFDTWATDRTYRYFFNRLGRHQVLHADLHGHSLAILIEDPREGCTYGCGPNDVLYLLGHLPDSDTDGISLVVFRQPTRKQELLSPVWGRCLYAANFGRYAGPAIMLEAIDPARSGYIERRSSLDEQDELERLRLDGHLLIQDRRGVTVQVSENSVRNTILYRTLLHEVGHWVHWQKQVLNPAANCSRSRREQLEDLYFAKPVRERELFAHNYAARQAKKLRFDHVIPFEPCE